MNELKQNETPKRNTKKQQRILGWPKQPNKKKLLRAPLKQLPLFPLKKKILLAFFFSLSPPPPSSFLKNASTVAFFLPLLTHSKPPLDTQKRKRERALGLNSFLLSPLTFGSLSLLPKKNISPPNLLKESSSLF